MIYSLFKGLFYLTVQGYFRTICLKGKSNIPDAGPVIFVANHNSAFMDPILLAVLINRPIYFLARGESFKNILVSKFFSTINMLPVYRPEVAPDKVHRNKSVFIKCFQHLKEGKAILIFPEGFSETVRKLRPLKTGTARIALGAEQQYNFDLGVKIVPIGINYSNPHHFRSNVILNFGKAINLNNFKNLYQFNEKEAVTELTDEIRMAMEELLVVINDDRLHRLIEQIEKLYQSTGGEVDLEMRATDDFHTSKDIIKTIEHFQHVNPSGLASFEEKLEKYLQNLEHLNIKDEQLRNSKFRLKKISRVTYLLLGAPLSFYGFLVNILPYSFAQFLSKSIRVRKDFIGSMKIAFGMFVFLFFYLVEIIAVGYYSNWYWAFLFGLSLYPAGLFTLNYLKRFYSLHEDYRYSTLFKKGKAVLVKLRKMRTELLKELDQIQASISP